MQKELADGTIVDLTQEELDELDAQNQVAETIKAKADEDAVDRDEVRQNAFIRALLDRRPAEIDAWVDTNVNNAADIQQVMKVLLKVVAILAKREIREND
jgi:hypothetical protein